MRFGKGEDLPEFTEPHSIVTTDSVDAEAALLRSEHVRR
jgi:hypothetical protein